MQVIRDSLEKLIGEERFEAVKESKLYNAAADIMAMNLFYTPFMTGVEMISGMELDEILISRLTAAVINTIIARPYSIARNKLFEKLNVTKESSFTKKYLSNTIMGLFWLPIYAGILTVAGVDSEEMIKAMGQSLVLGGLTAGPYGMWLDTFRNQCGLPTEYDQLDINEKYDSFK